jgi:hypothetical protein
VGGPIVAGLGVAIAVIAGLVDRYEKELPPVIAHNWTFMALIPTMVILVVLPDLTKRTGSTAFYEAAAQIIPVMLLAISLEVGFLRRGHERPALRVGILSIAVLALGEFSALQSIERGHGSKEQFGWVVAALTYGFLAIGLNALGPHAEQPQRT